MDSHFFRFEKTALHYSIYGNGKKALLGFHGYGQNRENLKVLEESLGLEFTIYAFDLFFHGESIWQEKGKLLTKEYWSGIIAVFLQERNIETFSVLGFSMGAKFALAMLEQFPHKISEVILIAPDGIKVNCWYRLVTSFGVLRKVFKKVIVHPAIYFRLVSLLMKIRLIDKGIIRFSNTQMQTGGQRARLFYSWTTFRLLRFDLNTLAQQINQHQIKVHFFLGSFDQIIPLKNILPFARKIKNFDIHVLESGHTHLLQAVNQFFKDKNSGK